MGARCSPCGEPPPGEGAAFQSSRGAFSDREDDAEARNDALIPEDLPWTAGTDEFDATLRRSWGWNLGIGHVEGAALATARDAARLDPRAARAIAASDRFLANVDRTPRNPNLLRRADGGLVAIDYGACLFLTRALAGRAGAFEHPAGHLLPPAPPAPTPTLAWRELLDDLPDAWIAAAGTGSAGLTAALAAYEAAAREVLGRA